MWNLIPHNKSLDVEEYLMLVESHANFYNLMFETPQVPSWLVNVLFVHILKKKVFNDAFSNILYKFCKRSLYSSGFEFFL